MKKFISIFLAVAIAITFLAVTPAVSASALETSNYAKRWNIMLVVDASGSMDKMTNPAERSDPKQLRFEAIGSFLSILQDDGHKIGAIAFDSAEGKQDTLLGAIAGEYPLTSLDDNSNAKDEIMYMLETTNPNQTGKATDIGSALLYALKMLQQEDNGQPSAIFLFTDGKNEVPGEHLINSEKNRDEAIKMIQEWDGEIKICGVYLNTKSKENDPNAMGIQEIIRKALSIKGENSNVLGNSYQEITNAYSCVASTDAFLSLLGYSMGSPDGSSGSKNFNAENSLNESFVVPGCGIEEINFRLHVLDSAELPDTEMILTRPDGIELHVNDSDFVKVDSMDTYQTWKVKNPMPGEWKVRAWVRENSNASISYTPFFSSNIDAKITIEPSQSKMYMNQDMKVSAWLELNGDKQTEADSYVGYTCVMTISEPGTDFVREIDLPIRNGSYEEIFYVDEAFLPYGYYNVEVAFNCNILSVPSKAATLDLNNNSPTLNAASLNEEVKYGLLQKSEKHFDLRSYFSDLEDDAAKAPLTMRIDRVEDCDMRGLNVDGNDLVVNAKLSGDGTVILRAIDSQGVETEPLTFAIRTTDVTPQVLMVIGIILAIIIVVCLIAAIIIGNCIANSKPNGDLIVSIPQLNNVELILTPPGAQGKRTDNLYNILMSAFSSPWRKAKIDEACAAAHLSQDALSNTIRENSGDLRKVIISVKIKKRVAGLKIRCRGLKRMLSSDPTPVSVGENTFNLVYRLPNDITDGFDFGGFSNSSASSAASQTDDSSSDWGNWGANDFSAADSKPDKKSKKKDRASKQKKKEADTFNGFGSYDGASAPDFGSFGGSSSTDFGSYGASSSGDFGSFGADSSNDFGGQSGKSSEENPRSFDDLKF